LRPAAAGGGTSFGEWSATAATDGGCWRKELPEGREIGHGGWREGGRSKRGLNGIGAWGRQLLG